MGLLTPLASTTIVLAHIYYYYYYFCPPKDQSIFGIHRQQLCQKILLGLDCVACIFIYVPLHGLGGYNVFVAKSAFSQQRELAYVTMSTAHVSKTLKPVHNEKSVKLVELYEKCC